MTSDLGAALFALRLELKRTDDEIHAMESFIANSRGRNDVEIPERAVQHWTDSVPCVPVRDA